MSAKTTKEQEVAKTKPNTPEERASKRVKDFTGMMWHVAVFVIINAFLWVITPGGAIWITIFWGIALAFHVAAYFLNEKGFLSSRYHRILAEEKEREDL